MSKAATKTTMEVLNTLVSFDQVNYDIGMVTMNDNLIKYQGIKNAFKTIMGKDIITTVDDLNTFICSKSGFPNLRASVQLLDWETEYDFILNNYDNVDMFLIDTQNNCVPAEIENAFRIEKTVRLADDPEHDFQVLKKVNELFATLKCKHSFNATNGVDVNIYMLNENYRIANSVKR